MEVRFEQRRQDVTHARMTWKREKREEIERRERHRETRETTEMERDGESDIHIYIYRREMERNEK